MKVSFPQSPITSPLNSACPSGRFLAVNRAIQERIAYQHEFRVVWADGSIHSTFRVAIPLNNPSQCDETAETTKAF